MRNRHTRERKELRILLNAAAGSRLPEAQLERERLETHRLYFQRARSIRRKGFWRRVKKDMDRREEARKAALEEQQVVPNRAQRRAHGVRGYGHGLGRMDVPK